MFYGPGERVAVHGYATPGTVIAVYGNTLVDVQVNSFVVETTQDKLSEPINRPYMPSDEGNDG